MQHVFVLSSTREPLMPCSPARARQALDRGWAAVSRRVPFTIVLRNRATCRSGALQRNAQRTLDRATAGRPDANVTEKIQSAE